LEIGEERFGQCQAMVNERDEQASSRIPNPESPIPAALEQLRETWHALGEDDPLWAILSDPEKRGGRWDADSFFAAGEQEIAAILLHCSALGRPHAHGLAVDFGCGVGRLSRALASRYAQVIGVDISPSMLARARELHVQFPNVRFVENATIGLGFIASGSVDLVYSVITLHHMPARLQLGYIAEFLRVLAPGGVAVFQIANGYSRDLRGLAYRVLPNRLLAPLRRHVHASRVAAELHIVDEAAVVAQISRSAKRVLQVSDFDSAGAGFRSRLFFVGD
jgi:SAM-dependent methyltransferase